MHSVRDRRTDRRHYHANSRSYCTQMMQYDRLKLSNSISELYGLSVSLAIWDFTVIWHYMITKWTHPALTPARQAGTEFNSPGGIEGWVDLDGLLVYRLITELDIEQLHCVFCYNLQQRMSLWDGSSWVVISLEVLIQSDTRYGRVGKPRIWNFANVCRFLGFLRFRGFW